MDARCLLLGFVARLEGDPPMSGVDYTAAEWRNMLEQSRTQRRALEAKNEQQANELAECQRERDNLLRMAERLSSDLEAARETERS